MLFAFQVNKRNPNCTELLYLICIMHVCTSIQCTIDTAGGARASDSAPTSQQLLTVFEVGQCHTAALAAQMCKLPAEIPMRSERPLMLVAVLNRP